MAHPSCTPRRWDAEPPSRGWFVGGVVRGWRFVGVVGNACLRWARPASLRARLRHAWRAGRPPPSGGSRVAGAGLLAPSEDWQEVRDVVRGWRLVGVVWTLACGGPGRLRCVRAFGTLGGRDALRPARPSHGRGCCFGVCWGGATASCFATAGLRRATLSHRARISFGRDATCSARFVWFLRLPAVFEATAGGPSDFCFAGAA